ncbi:glycosyltransferase [Fodinisporobacter ferrooxydans]|uniref:Glycosyltransferase n=1 Tax=Fodinisporobacter ferrooxydans TaxID=2901836 RepID=A0ABY4CJC6_9BACL|nr:glycosyltransferase [Alicyclobacillaceae bacterium MYW30-H2]
MENQGVSIITCTKKPQFMEMIFNNYNNQKWDKKELIIILNRNNMRMQEYKRKASQFKNVKVFKLPETATLGACLNYGIQKAVYPYIAKFDDDDFYGARYIEEAMKTMNRVKADIVGKRAIYTFIEYKNVLLLRFSGGENKFVNFIAGGSIFMKKSVWQTVPFRNITLGEDIDFLQRARKKGYKIYSSSKNHFIGIRRKNPIHHTWFPDINYLLKTGKRIGTAQTYHALTMRFLQ